LDFFCFSSVALRKFVNLFLYRQNTLSQPGVYHSVALPFTLQKYLKAKEES
jgi:hypothetical protein